MKQKSLDTIILEEAIRAKLTEQTDVQPLIDPRGAAAKKQTIKDIAQQIFNSKGLLWDDPAGTNAAIRRIKSVNEFNAVTAELKKLTGGLDIAAYLKTFLDRSDKKTWEFILDYLKKQFASSPKETYYPIGRVYFMLMNDLTNPTHGKIGAKYVSPEFLKWWKQKSVNTIAGMSTSPLSIITQTMQQALYKYRHEIATVGAIATAFIPVIGPVLSAGIGLADAKMYYDEGDKYTAGLITFLSLIPGGKAVAKGLARKIITKSGTLTAAETRLLTKLASNKNLAKEQMAKLLQKAVESGKVTDAMLKKMGKFLKPVGKGAYMVAGTGLRIITPLIVYDKAWAAANPTVTLAQMNAVVAEADKRFNRELDIIFKSVLKQPGGVVKGIRIGETAGSINEFEFEPSDSTSQEPSQTAQNVAFGVGAGIGLSSLAGKIVIGTGSAAAIFGIPWLMKNVFGIKIFKLAEAVRLIRDTWRINRTLKKYTNNGIPIRGFTLKEYRSIVQEIDDNALKELRETVMKVHVGELTPEAAAAEFLRFRSQAQSAYPQLLDKLGKVYKSDQKKRDASKIVSGGSVAAVELADQVPEFYKSLLTKYPLPTQTKTVGYQSTKQKAEDLAKYKEKRNIVLNQRLEAANQAGHLSRKLIDIEKNYLIQLIQDNYPRLSSKDIGIADRMYMLNKHISDITPKFLQWRALNPSLDITKFKI